jgi:polysaccharide pyruvyl transferase WcaK-like protein
MGWLGYKNIGDEACLAAIKQFLPKNCKIICWDMHPWKRTVIPDLSIIGGGTLLDGAYDARGRAMASLLYKGVPTVFWGTGVLPHKGKLALQTLKILNKATFVGVRGPISHRILNKGGYSNSVLVGDPALLLTHKSKPQGLASNKIAINIGDARGRLWGKEPVIVKHTRRLIAGLTKRGYEVVLFPMWPSDNKYIQQIPKRKNVYIRGWAATNYLLDFFRSCRCVIGMKLHACVLSAAADVPFISIAYREKCIDFAESLGLEKWAIKSNDADLSGKILAKVASLPKYYQVVVDRIAHHKRNYRNKHNEIKDLVSTFI